MKLCSKKFKTLVFILVSLGLQGCDVSMESSLSKVKVSLSGVNLEIPKKYLLENEVYGKENIEGLDTSNDILLSLNLNDIGLKGISSSEARSDLLVRLFVKPNGKNKYGYSADVMSAWNGDGLYKDRVVEKKDGLYRVYSSHAYPKMWHYFKVPPDAGQIKMDDWVAECRVSPAVQEKENLNNVRCVSIARYDQINIELSFTGYYISEIGKVRTALVNFVGSTLLTADQEMDKP